MVVAKFGSSPSAAASSFKVSSVPSGSNQVGYSRHYERRIRQLRVVRSGIGCWRGGKPGQCRARQRCLQGKRLVDLTLGVHIGQTVTGDGVRISGCDYPAIRIDSHTVVGSRNDCGTPERHDKA